MRQFLANQNAQSLALIFQIESIIKFWQNQSQTTCFNFRPFLNILTYIVLNLTIKRGIWTRDHRMDGRRRWIHLAMAAPKNRISLCFGGIQRKHVPIYFVYFWFDRCIFRIRLFAPRWTWPSSNLFKQANLSSLSSVTEFSLSLSRTDAFNNNSSSNDDFNKCITMT